MHYLVIAEFEAITPGVYKLPDEEHAYNHFKMCCESPSCFRASIFSMADTPFANGVELRVWNRKSHDA
jgi:hypothetical protein